MAVTSDVTHGTAGSGYPATDLPKVFIIENIVDFSATNRVATNILQVLHVKAGTYVMLAGIQVLVVEDGTATIDLGDGTDDDGYLAAQDIEAATGFFTSWTAYTTSSADLDLGNATQLFGIQGGKFYTANDTIDVVTNHTLDAGKIRVFAIIFDCTGRA